MKDTTHLHECPSCGSLLGGIPPLKCGCGHFGDAPKVDLVRALLIINGAASRTCDRCKHWESAPTEAGDEVFGICLDISDPKDHEDRIAKLHINEGERWPAQTGPKFGCVHWEAHSLTT